MLLKFLFDSALENLSAQRRHALDSATRRLETLRSQVEHAQLSSSSSLKELVYSPDHCTQRSDIPITDSSLSDHHSSTSDEKPRMNMVNLQAELLRQQAHCDRLAAAASTPLTVSALPPEVVDVCEEIAFWLLTAVIESRLGYYSRNMCGIDVDVKVLSTLLSTLFLPHLYFVSPISNDILFRHIRIFITRIPSWHRVLQYVFSLPV